LFWASPTVIPTRVRRYLFTHYTPEILLNPVFEDLRKPKVPNRWAASDGSDYRSVEWTAEITERQNDRLLLPS
jgi:hypothetical protein